MFFLEYLVRANVSRMTAVDTAILYLVMRSSWTTNLCVMTVQETREN